ncbi:MAG: Wzz/FepE/Etk N-terminal domain-containing protein [Verrucomicrobiales bacterium]
MPTPQHNRSPFALAREPQPSFPQIPALGDPSAGGSAIPLLDIGRLAGLLLRRWWVIALCAGFFTALALAYVLTAAKRYQSNAAIYVGREPERILKGVTDVTQKDLKELEELKTVEQILGSTTLILQAVEANGLRDDPSFAPPKPDGSAYSDAEMVGIFSEHYGAALRRGTRLIDIWFEDTDAERAQRIAASMFDVFREHTRGQAQTANQRAKEALEAKRIELATELDEAEHDMLDYRARHADLPLDEDQNVIEQRLRDLEGELTKATAERLRLESDVEKIAQIGPGQPESILRLGSVSQLDEVSELVRAINLKEAEFARLSERYASYA